LIEYYDSDGILKKRIHGPDHFFPAEKEIKKEEVSGFVRSKAEILI